MNGEKPLVERLEAGIETSGASETVAVGERLAAVIPPNQVLALHGDLGAGKTTLVRGLASGWGIREAVTSPTFNLYSIYRGTRQLIHLDAYRLTDETDLNTLMIEDFLREPWCLVIEWPTRIKAAIPPDAWHLSLEILEANRHRLQLAPVSKGRHSNRMGA